MTFTWKSGRQAEVTVTASAAVIETERERLALNARRGMGHFSRQSPRLSGTGPCPVSSPWPAAGATVPADTTEIKPTWKWTSHEETLNSDDQRRSDR